MPITSTHHGLSVHTGADGEAGAGTADNRRLRRPLPVADDVNYINNAFNDATSGEVYPQRAGHEGLDFYTVPTEVEAMYGGVVVKVVDNWKPSSGGIGLGNSVTIRSCTDPDVGTGFEHTYAHMQEDAKMPGDPDDEDFEKGIVVTPGMTVWKGQKLGTSGGSGTYTGTGDPVNYAAQTATGRSGLSLCTGRVLGHQPPF